MKFRVTDEKNAALQARLAALGVQEADLVEKFLRGSGPGGQKVNKTSSAVYLKHLPTGIEVKVNTERSQSVNRYLARRELCDRIEARLHGSVPAEEARVARLRKQKDRRARRTRKRSASAEPGDEG